MIWMTGLEVEKSWQAGPLQQFSGKYSYSSLKPGSTGKPMLCARVASQQAELEQAPAGLECLGQWADCE